MEFIESDLRFILLHQMRCLTFIGLLPLYAGNNSARLGKLVLGLALGILVALQTSRSGFTDPGFSLLLIACLAKEMFIGGVLAWVAIVTFAITKSAGHLIGEEMGFNVATIQDPVTGVTSPVIAQFLEFIAMVVFFATNSHHAFLRALHATFARDPVGSWSIDARHLGVALDYGARILTGGLELAAPVFATLLVVSVALSILAKVAPELHIMQLAFVLKVGLGLVLLVFALDVIVPTFVKLFESSEGVLAALLEDG